MKKSHNFYEKFNSYKLYVKLSKYFYDEVIVIRTNPVESLFIWRKKFTVLSNYDDDMLTEKVIVRRILRTRIFDEFFQWWNLFYHRILYILKNYMHFCVLSPIEDWPIQFFFILLIMVEGSIRDTSWQSFEMIGNICWNINFQIFWNWKCFGSSVTSNFSFSCIFHSYTLFYLFAHLSVYLAYFFLISIQNFPTIFNSA